jgi:membrane protease YdiL (CAAX protease family)
MFDESFFFRVLVSALLTASALSWLRWGLRPEQFGGPSPELPGETSTPSSDSPLEMELEEPIRWPTLAIFAMVFWVGTMVTSQIVEDFGPILLIDKITHSADDPPELKENSSKLSDHDALWAGMVQQCAVFVVLGTLLFATGRLRPEQVGITGENWPGQIAWGFQAFLAAIWPTFLVLIATAWFRSRETDHPFLRMIRDSPDQVPLMMMFFTAAVVAPLSEELVFRVTLQGWLSDLWCPRGAIVITAVIFSFVHGWRDGIALIPLSLILGYLYHSRRSYLSVATTHALFNAANMAMALLGAMSAPE